MSLYDETVKGLAQMVIPQRSKTQSYDTPATVLRIEDGIAYVHIEGGVDETPVALTINAEAGDNVLVRVSGGKAWITGNSSAPPTDDRIAISADTKATEAKEEIRTVRQDLVVTNEVVAQKATIEELDAEKARINSLEVGKADVTDLNAATGRIGQLEATALTADSATIKDLQANKANVSDLTAATGRIGQLEADHVSTADLEAVQADIDNLEATKADVAVLEADYAKIDLANVNTAQIKNGVIQTAAIVDEQVFTVTGNKATIKEIDADNINVRNLNAKNLKIETADGYIMLGDKKTPTKEFIDSLTNDLNDRIDGAIETFTATAVPTLSNYPANDWKTAEERATHVGDVCYVVNDQIAQNGYCYRFTLNGSTFSWQLIKDSDVTAALHRLQTAEGKIGDIEQFDEDIATFKTETEGEISTLQTKTSTLETSLGDKVDKTTFNEVSQKVDENSASITTLETNVAKKADSSTVTTLSNTVNRVSQKADSNEAAISDLTETVETKADSSTVSTLTQTVNSVKQTADGNSSTITSLTTTLGTNSDGTTKAGDIVHRTSAVEQDLSGFKTTVSQTYHKTSDFNTYKTANDSAVAAAKKAGTDAQSSLNSYKTTNDAAVANAKKAGDDAQADLDAYKGTVSETYATKSSVTQTADGIKAEVASTYTTQTTFNNYKSSNDTAVAGVKTTADAAKEAIDGLEIGGRNLLPGSKDFSGWNLENGVTIEWDESKKAYKLTVKRSGVDYMFGVYRDITVDPNATYTMSCDMAYSNGSFISIGIGVYASGQSKDWPSSVTTISTEKKRYSYTFKTTESQTECRVYLAIKLDKSSDEYVGWFALPKLEKGNRASDWTPAPEDLEAATTAVASDLETVKTTYVKNSTFETTTEQIRGEVSAVETTAKNYTDGKIATEVSDRNSAITQKADEITSSVSATYATKTSVPTKVSQLTNDSKYATQTEAQGYASTAESNAKADTTNKLKSYSTTSQMNTAISQSASSIEAKITASETASKEYADGLIEDEVTARNAAIKASADSITSTVSETYATKGSVPTKTSDLTNDSNYATTTQAQGYANTAESNAKTAAQGYADDAEQNAKDDATERLKSYSTTVQMNSAIEQSATSIKQTVSETYATKGAIPTKVSQLSNDSNYATQTQAQGYASTAESNAKADTTEKLKSYSTTAQVTSAINQKAGEITQTVSETYQTKADMDDYSTTTEMNSAIDQKADAITTSVSNTYATKSSLKTTSDNLAGYITSNNAALKTMQDQIDGAIETWFYTVDPTTTNAPAKDWGTTDLKNQHLGDLYYNTATGHVFRWQLSGSTYSWTEIEDTDARKALADAAAAQAIANSKRRVFVAQPTTPYEVGDLWVQGTSGDIMRCSTARASGSYTASDWVKASKYTDDTALNSFKTTYNTKMEQTDQAIALKANASEVYTKSQTDGLISTEVTNRNAAITAASDSITASVAETYTTKTEFNNLEIGGRNLLRYTSVPADLVKINAQATDWSNATEDGIPCVKGVNNNTMHLFGYTNTGTIYQTELLKANTTYTYSAWIKVNKAASFNYRSYGHFQVNNRASTASDKTHEDIASKRIYEPSSIPSNTWTKIRLTFTTNDLAGSTFGVYPAYNNGTDVVIYMYGWKLEEGNKATDWSPAPEDLESYADTAVANAKSEIKVTTDGISTEVAKKVGSSEIISKINQSAETVKIQASKVEVDGTLIIGKSTAESVAKTEVDSVQVGGRNLLLGSKDFSGWNIENRVSVEWDESKKAYKLTVNRSGVDYMFGVYRDITVDPNATYTMSCDMAYSNGSFVSIGIGVYASGQSKGWPSSVTTNDTEKKRYSYTFKTTESQTECRVYLAIKLDKSSSEYVGWFALPKLEKGTKPTDWSPAPEDVDAGIASASQTASKYITADSTSGIKVHAEANPTTNYTQIDETGMTIYQGVDGVATEVASFKASGARVGRQNSGHTDVDSQGMSVYGGDGTEQLVNIGCVQSTLPDGTQTYEANFTFGKRTGDVGAYSTAIGWKNVVARGDTAFAVGNDILASGDASHAGGSNVINRSWGGFAHGIGLEAKSSVDAQAAFGKYNDPTKTKDDYGLAFTVGNGTDEDNRSNAFEVYENGDINAKGKITAYGQPLIAYEQQIAYISFAAGTVGTRAAVVSLGSTSRDGYAFLGAYILDHQNTAKFSVDLVRNDSTGTMNVVAYRATAGAVTDAPVRVRMIWSKTNITEYVNNS